MWEESYSDLALLFKAHSDETRLKLADMLSCAELCACDILKNLNISQPTLSYDIKILTESGIVNANRVGAWIHYTFTSDIAKHITDSWEEISTNKEIYICKDHNNCHKIPLEHC